jgi:phosphoribosyl 1,2-cyclic phosphodiesterase
MQVATLATGSAGNCTWVNDGTNQYLIDCGLPLSTVEKRLATLGTDLANVSAVVVTHDHIDHAQGVPALTKKYGIQKVDRIDDPTFALVPVSHDAPCNAILHGAMFHALDLGDWDETTLAAANGCEILVIDCNHIVDLVRFNENYHQALKRRILGPEGHLSNEQVVSLIEAMDEQPEHIVLAHLSRQNQREEIAWEQIENAVNRKNWKSKVHLSRQNETSELLRI